MASSNRDPDAGRGRGEPSPHPGSQRMRIRDLLADADERLGLRALTAEVGLDREITYPRIQKAALAVTGYIDAVHPGRLQVLGAGEITYLRTRAPRKRAALVKKVCSQAPVCCFVVTNDLDVPEELLEQAKLHEIPIVLSSAVSSTAIALLQGVLDHRLAPRSQVHGVMVDVYGVGVLILGESGIGKSECALDLVTRGQRLVSDDVVEIRRESSGVLVGSGPEMTREHMEVRGLGLVNIRDLFGISAIRERKFVELVVMLEAWQKGKAYDRLGIDRTRYTLLDVELPLLRMPVAPGRNLAMLIEVATRNHLLENRGYHAARRLLGRMDADLQERIRREREALLYENDDEANR